jgi:hypothetical protein
VPIPSLLLGLALLVVVLPFVAEPILRPRRAAQKLQAAASAAADTPSKDAALVALRDLDFDFSTGKVTEADYAPLRQQLLAAAAQAVQKERPPARSARPVARGADDAIEAAVRAHRAVSGSADDPIEAAVRRVRGEAGRRCPQCQAPAQPDDRFCHTCGASLDVPARACPACGQPAQSSDRFCGACGAALSEQVESHS